RAETLRAVPHRGRRAVHDVAECRLQRVGPHVLDHGRDFLRAVTRRIRGLRVGGPLPRRDPHAGDPADRRAGAGRGATRRRASRLNRGPEGNQVNGAPARAAQDAAVPAETDPQRVFRTIDWLLVPLLFMVVQAAFHIHAMLTVGDWDFWTDWKDRRFWLVVTPVSLITFPAAVQYVLWDKFRLPIGATAAVVGLLLGQWVSRVTNFYGWTYFPLNFTR